MADNQTSLARTFLAGLWQENPVLRLILGMCPTLAVTTSVQAALTMGASVIFVLIGSNLVVSLMRNLLKPHLRILMFTLTIAAFVTVADLFLKAYQPAMSAKLGPYIPLIIVNCIIICRAEACASKNGLLVSLADAVGMGLGFTGALAVLALVRELLATGQIVFEFGQKVTLVSLPDVPLFRMAGMAMPVGAFLTLGLMLGLVKMVTSKRS
ncbi:MAG TPA: electron transport complex subunit RsxE [Anaerohalosphaeraceae bacterium]|nr:electron transport complex subunit RsxE [Anaerohalosphaeraceae bacterium]